MKNSLFLYLVLWKPTLTVTEISYLVVGLFHDLVQVPWSRNRAKRAISPSKCVLSNHLVGSTTHFHKIFSPHVDCLFGD